MQRQQISATSTPIKHCNKKINFINYLKKILKDIDKQNDLQYKCYGDIFDNLECFLKGKILISKRDLMIKYQCRRLKKLIKKQIQYLRKEIQNDSKQSKLQQSQPQSQDIPLSLITVQPQYINHESIAVVQASLQDINEQSPKEQLGILDQYLIDKQESQAQEPNLIHDSQKDHSNEMQENRAVVKLVRVSLRRKPYTQQFDDIFNIRQEEVQKRDQMTYEDQFFHPDFIAWQ